MNQAAGALRSGTSPEPTVSKPMQGEPRIAAAIVAAAHDGRADLVVTLRYPNGATDLVVLDESTAARVMTRCGIDDPALLVDRSWRELLAYPED